MGRVSWNGRQREPQTVGLRYRFPPEEHPGAADRKGSPAPPVGSDGGGPLQPIRIDLVSIERDRQIQIRWYRGRTAFRPKQ